MKYKFILNLYLTVLILLEDFIDFQLTVLAYSSDLIILSSRYSLCCLAPNRRHNMIAT